MKIILIKHFFKQKPLLHGVKLALGYSMNLYDSKTIKGSTNFSITIIDHCADQNISETIFTYFGPLAINIYENVKIHFKEILVKAFLI